MTSVLAALALLTPGFQEKPKPIGPLLEPVLTLDSGQELLVGKPLKLHVGLKNVGDADAWLDGRLVESSHLRFNVFDQAGERVTYPGWNSKGRVAPPQKEDFVKLSPGFSLVRPVQYEMIVFTLPGTYRVQVTGSHGASRSSAENYGIKLSPFKGSVSITVVVKSRVSP